MDTETKTIEVTQHADLLAHADPVGLLRDPSARSYQKELRQRIKSEFPDANVFLKWNPNRTGEPEVFTFPRVRETEARVMELVEEVKGEPDLWLNYDESMRAAF